MIMRRLFFVFNIIAILSLLVQGGAYQSGQASAPIMLEGTFNVIWGDGAPGSGDARTTYFLSTYQSAHIKLLLDENLLESAGGSFALNRQPVVIQGVWAQVGKVLQVQSLALVEGATGGPEGVSGPQPWVSILCKFSDYADEPNNLDYFLGMYSNIYPGLDHYWRQQSYDIANLEGSGAFGWYDLPFPRDHYLPGGNLDWGAAAEDCTAAADPYVDFTPYVGINLMFNATLDCCAWGGSWYLCLDGLCQNWRMTWEPPWGYQNIGVIAHETGHGFGLPHSSGEYGQTYDNQWDVMSDLWSNGYRGGTDPTYGTLGQHTISYHKEMLDWITSEQMFTSVVGAINTITLEQIALPQTNNYLGARVLINDSPDHFFTVEARRLVGYDSWLPGGAVIIHEVIVTRDIPAHVVDIDGNGNTGDEGAMWRPGETFTSQQNGIAITVDSATPTGFVVTIRNRFTDMISVDINGAEQGYIGESIPFTATVSPITATTPITYVWQVTNLSPITHSGETTDTIAFTWEETGTKTITVTATNAGGSVVDTHIIDIGQKTPIVSLSGPASGLVGITNTFTATIVPTDVTQPITYVWQASGQIPMTHTAGISDTVSYVWDDPGTQAITITAINVQGSTTDTLSLPIFMPPANLVVTGAEVGDVQDSYTFTASVTPLTTTIPITYIWAVDGQIPITHTTGVVDTAAFSWDSPGIYNLSVSATNQAGRVEATWSITIVVKVYLPITFR